MPKAGRNEGNSKELREQKEKFLEALSKHRGNRSEARKATNTTQYQMYAWLANDPDFKERITHIEDEILDFVEDRLLDSCALLDVGAIKFYLSRKGKKRGWADESIKSDDDKTTIIVKLANVKDTDIT